jgi:hypothetical protein
MDEAGRRMEGSALSGNPREVVVTLGLGRFFLRYKPIQKSFITLAAFFVDEEELMKIMVWLALLLSAAVLVAQDGNSASPQAKRSKATKDEITIRGCVSRANSDYILMKQNPDVTYELQATGKIRLKNYLGHRVELTGHESTTLSSSSDALNKVGSAAPVTITITSIKTIDQDCSVAPVAR